MITGQTKRLISEKRWGSLPSVRKRYLQKHPQLASFLASQSCAFLCIDVKSIYVVERFQNVIEVHLD
ncbi:MAG: hypothetical protein ACYSOO_02510 [Planctomycetota bacterium]